MFVGWRLSRVLDLVALDVIAIRQADDDGFGIGFDDRGINDAEFVCFDEHGVCGWEIN